MYIRFLILFSFCSLVMLEAAGQKVELNQEGYRIVKYDDGSWRYFQPSDSIYLKKETTTYVTSAVITPSAKQDISIEELVQKLTLKAKFEREKYSNAQAKKLYLENQLQVAKQSPGPDQDSRLAQIKDELNVVKSQEKDYKKSYKKAQKWADNGLNVLHEPIDKQLNFINKYNEYDQSVQLALAKPEPIKIEDKPQSPDHFDRARASKDIFKNPPEMPCDAEQTFDNLTGVKRVDTSRRLLFEHSPEKLMPYLKGEPYIRTYAYLTAVRGYVLLNLDVVISTDQATSSIGGINRDAEIIFQFLDGTRAVVNNRLATEGRIDPLKKNTSFLLQCEINKNLKKVFTKELLDKIIINWKRGYQEYPIYDVDHFHASFKCLEDGV